MSVALLFPGQGSQQVGMGQALYEQEPGARAVFDQADEILGFPLSSLCFHGPEEALTDTVNQQPALLVIGIAIWRVAQERGFPPPAYMAGHSLGEFTALVAAGTLPFAEGLKLVRHRGELMKEAGEKEPGAMAAIIALDPEQVAAICERAAAESERPLQIANLNCPGQIVISGDETALDLAMAWCKEAGARKVVKLAITIAAHSGLMASAAADFATAVDHSPLTAPDIPVIGNVSAQPLTTAAEIRSELKAQLTSPVRWTESISYLVDQGVDTFIEAGPDDVLLGLVKRIQRKSTRTTLSQELDITL